MYRPDSEATDTPPLSPNKADMIAHLYALFPPLFVHAYPDAMVEVIYGPPGVFTVSRWFSAFDLKTIVEFAEERSASGDNVYVGAALRKGPIPETGRANEVENYLAAQHGWSEYEGDGDHERIASICKAKGLQPAIKIVTGTTPYPREHLYFRIKGGISSIAEQRAVNTALRNLLSSDDVRDAIRILRLGGCINTPTAEKYAKKYIRELVTVQVAREPREYTVEELLALCGAEIVDDVIDLNEVKSRRTDDELFNLLEETKIAKHWHNAMRNAIATMIGRGWSDDAIRFSCAPYCIGGKDDPDLDALIDGGRTKWDKPNPDNSQPQASATTAKVIYYNDLDALPPKVWLIKNVLAAGETSNWFGPPGYAKSALLVDVSFHAASDQDWRGYRTKKKCGVVYFALERGLLVTRRLAYLHKSTGKADLPIAVVPGIMNLMHPGCVKYVVGTIRTAEARFQCEVGLVIIDTISKGIAAGGGDEDKAKDVNIVLANLRRIEEQLDVHIAVVGHTGKDQKKGHRGSSAHIGDVDLMVQISKSGEVMTATVIKANDQPDGDLTHFKIEVVETDIDEDGDPVVTTIVSDELVEAGKEAKSNRLSGAQSRALELLTRCINDVGRPPPASTQYPKNIRVVSLFEWHTMCERGSLSAAEDKRSRDRVFRRAKDDLQTMHRIACLDGLVWLVRDDG